MNRKVLFGLVIGAAALTLIGRRRRSSTLGALGWPAVRHAISRTAHSGLALAKLTDAETHAHAGRCRDAVKALREAEYAAGKASAHAVSTADMGTAKALDPAHSPRRQIAAARYMRKQVRAIAQVVDARCLHVPRRSPPPADPRQGTLL